MRESSVNNVVQIFLANPRPCENKLNKTKHERVAQVHALEQQRTYGKRVSCGQASLFACC